MNPQAFHGPVRLSYKFQHLPNGERFDILCKIHASPEKKGTIGIWKWHVYKDILVVASLKK